MKKSKKFIIGAILCAIGVIGLFGLFTDTSDKVVHSTASPFSLPCYPL